MIVTLVISILPQNLETLDLVSAAGVLLVACALVSISMCHFFPWKCGLNTSISCAGRAQSSPPGDVMPSTYEVVIVYSAVCVVVNCSKYLKPCALPRKDFHPSSLTVDPARGMSNRRE